MSRCPKPLGGHALEVAGKGHGRNNAIDWVGWVGWVVWAVMVCNLFLENMLRQQSHLPCEPALFKSCMTLRSKHLCWYQIGQATLHPAARCTWANHSKVCRKSTSLENLEEPSVATTGLTKWGFPNVMFSQTYTHESDNHCIQAGPTFACEGSESIGITISIHFHHNQPSVHSRLKYWKRGVLKSTMQFPYKKW